MKICESCLHHRRLAGDEILIGVNPENRRTAEGGEAFYLFCSYFHSYPSASARVSCSQYQAPRTEEAAAGLTLAEPIG